jgi:ABC-type lipoprotein export system ATPase subunit
LNRSGWERGWITGRPNCPGGSDSGYRSRALANDPDVILADEPTGNLDTETGDQIMRLLTDLNEDGKTIVMVTHDPHDAEYADRVVEITDGVTHPREE